MCGRSNTEKEVLWSPPSPGHRKRSLAPSRSSASCRPKSCPACRCGLHTGEAQLRDNVRYFGHASPGRADCRDLGHAGQILLSRACLDLAADHLPLGASVDDLGTHRMRDLGRPEQVYQLAHPDLPAHFPPLRSLDRHPHNLPVQLTSFVGRDAAMAEVGAQWPSTAWSP